VCVARVALVVAVKAQSGVRVGAEVNVNDMVSTYNSDVRTFAGNPIRLFLDNLLPVAICSFKSSVSSKNRSEVLFDLVNECNLSIAELMKLLSCSFENNFQVRPTPLHCTHTHTHTRALPTRGVVW